MRVIKPIRSSESNIDSDDLSHYDKSSRRDTINTASDVAPNVKSKRNDRLTGNKSKNQTPRMSADRRPKNKQSDASQAYDRGVRLLAMREHSAHEIIDKLTQKGVSIEIANDVLEQLRQQNYQSDSRFAEMFVRSKKNRGVGPDKIRNELKQKGISSTLIDEYLNSNSASWFDSAKQQYQKKYGDEPVCDYNNWSKRARFLRGRGFTMEQIHACVPPVDAD